MTSVSNGSDTTIYTFDRFQLEAARRLLRTDTGETIPLVSKAFDTLLYFVTNPGRVIGKDELMSSIWPDTVVEENNLNKNVSILRRVLGDDRRDHRYIVTVPGQGYKFVADVRTTEAAGASSTEMASTVVAPEKSYKTVVAVAIVAGLLILGMAGFFWTRRAA